MTEAIATNTVNIPAPDGAVWSGQWLAGSPPPPVTLPVPADAQEVGKWIDGGHGPDGEGWFRFFSAHNVDAEAHFAGPVEVSIRGEQFADGRENRAIVIEDAQWAHFTADEARGLAGVLLDTAQHHDGRRAAVVIVDEFAAALDAYGAYGPDRLVALARQLVAGG